MSRSGCSALRGVNPNLRKIKFEVFKMKIENLIFLVTMFNYRVMVIFKKSKNDSFFAFSADDSKTLVSLGKKI